MSNKVSVSGRATVRDVQRVLLDEIVKTCRDLGQRPILADITMSPRPKLWLCCTPAERTEITARFKAQCIHISHQMGRQLIEIDPAITDAISTIAYKRYVIDQVELFGADSGIEIEFCRKVPEQNVWRAGSGVAEIEASEDYLQNLEVVEYLGQTLPVLGNTKVLSERAPYNEKVDVVYTWVDGADPKWQSKKNGTPLNQGTLNANAPTRFLSGQELLYSIRSLQRYFVDLGKIYIVTDDQTPDFLGDLLDEVSIIDHREIFPSHDHLPCFNSHAIGANLHRIPGLSQRYLYFNDDVLLGAPVSVATFFDELGRAYQFPSQRTAVPHKPLFTPENAVDAAARNNQRLLEKLFGTFAFRKYKHTPVCVDRLVMEQMERDLPEAWQSTLPNRIRSVDDHSIAGHLYMNYSASLGKSVLGRIRYRYFDLANPLFESIFPSILDSEWTRPQTFCVNDTKPSEFVDANRKVMEHTLEQLYSQEAPQVDTDMRTEWEKAPLPRKIRRVLGNVKRKVLP